MQALDSYPAHVCYALFGVRKQPPYMCKHGFLTSHVCYVLNGVRNKPPYMCKHGFLTSHCSVMPNLGLGRSRLTFESMDS